MTTSPNPQQPDPSASMVEADTANGEAPDTDLQVNSHQEKDTHLGDDTGLQGITRPGLDEPVEHPTGARQAEENIENDPPA